MQMHQTITTHFGKQNIGSAHHNDRTHITKATKEHIDSARTKDNFIIIADQEKEVYETTFRQSMDAYNQKALKQSHPERVMDMDEYRKKNTYEIIFQIGNVNTLGVQECSQSDKAIINDIMFQAVYMMKRSYPNIKITQAIVHWDEASPHMHVRYVGVANELKRGMQTQANRKKAFEQMGFQCTDSSNKDDNPTTKFTKHLQDAFIQLCEQNGIIRDESSRGKNSPNMSVEQYKDWCKVNSRIEEMSQKADAMQKQANDALEKFNKVNDAFKNELNINIRNGQFEKLAKANTRENIQKAILRGDFER